MQTTYLKNTLSLSCILLLTACVSLKLPNKGSQNFQKEPPQTRAAALRKIHYWSINGAFSVQHHRKAELANYTWTQQNGAYDIRLSSALNLYTVSITGKPGQVSLHESKQGTLSASSPETLLTKRLGWSLPISDLNFWIRGLPAPGNSTPHYDSYGHLQSVQQQGWSVYFSNYSNVGKYDLPRTLNIEGHHLKIKVLIKNWSSVG